MASGFKYWNDCVDPLDMEAMWMDSFVRKEWDDVGETKGQKVHLSRDPEGEPFLTQTEMKTVAEIVVRRHFQSQVDPDMICAIAELQSDRQLLTTRYNKKTEEPGFGIMQLSPKTAEWLIREMGYRQYEIEGDSTLLYRPFISVYFGAAYLKWLSRYDEKERNEEFVVRAYKGGTKKAKHKSTLDYWRRYLSVKQSLPSRREIDNASMPDASTLALPVSEKTGHEWTYWDSRASPENMEEMWNNPDVLKEWTKSNEKRGKVRFSHDAEKRPYLSQTEVKAVAEIILSKHFSTRKVKPTVLAALAEVCSMRFVNGVGSSTGIMGIDYPMAQWLYKDIGYKAYQVQSVEDLFNPFASMYFGAAYMAWLSQYGGRERTPEFIVQAYLGGPENVNLQQTGPLWIKFEEALSQYPDTKKDKGTCSIL
ncbi:uncharacterized protein LOC122082419 isoform X1 [Macadamia integrifolia]|uniref:uncharacterized protein LOC122082419 isoform X1 n=1 Tax=Macadamia integrifolia TaxID=60698 RepID=UPI001C4E4A2D|nr:uncharacterized protein LOC122082419 isoform X1 [Macadamia integrifolia]XP_042505902.1 uncharacterized protein LOC122082419 isoform X1 [Macadamia integrifolia]XP_042505903.1 uncharacterized protein LOC122082419 isoform X1 [Macadamia integrifolia]XP_042505904.1 uncharacterized protein LOC122082419 isoform X1 [Macadamia integrifolia]